MKGGFKQKCLWKYRADSAIMAPLLSALILWLAIIFFGLGLYTANNSTVFAILLICAASVSSAVFLIEELSHPIEGLMQISIDPLYNALNQVS